MTMSGFMVPTPSAIADVMALIRLIEDPKAFKESLDQLKAASDQLVEKIADINKREAAIVEGEAAAGKSKEAMAEERKKLDAAYADADNREARLNAAKEKHAANVKEHNERVALVVAREQELVEQRTEADRVDNELKAAVADLAAKQKALDEERAQLDADSEAFRKRAAAASEAMRKLQAA